LCGVGGTSKATGPAHLFSRDLILDLNPHETWEPHLSINQEQLPDYATTPLHKQNEKFYIFNSINLNCLGVLPGFYATSFSFFILNFRSALYNAIKISRKNYEKIIKKEN
jgi:hypothetical protein